MQTILELLWEISHLPELPKHLVEQALTEQLSVLTEMTFNKEATKRTYVFKCVDSIKKANKSVVISAKHLYDICKSYSKGTSAYHKPDKVRNRYWNSRQTCICTFTVLVRLLLCTESWQANMK